MRQYGSIEVICGSMFSGKSEELIRRLRRAAYGRKRVQIFKPNLDTRYSADEIVSHVMSKLRAVNVVTSKEVLELVRDKTEVIGIDEVQFLDKDIVNVCQKLANLGKRVIVSGLDMDYRGEPFEPMPTLMSIAEEVTKIRAICVQCGGPASYSQRLIKQKERVVLGATDSYEARCRMCFDPDLDEFQQVDLFHTESNDNSSQELNS